MTDPASPVPAEGEASGLPAKPASNKERMTIERVAMPEQPGGERAHNFGEVNQGLTYQLAMLEAERCIQCPKPFCVDGCPVRVNIPRFIKFLRDGETKYACVDGPEFDAHKVNFQELADRLTTYKSFEAQALDKLGACATTEVKS